MDCVVIAYPHLQSRWLSFRTFELRMCQQVFHPLKANNHHMFDRVVWHPTSRLLMNRYICVTANW